MMDFTPPEVKAAKAGAKLFVIGLCVLVVVIGIVSVLTFINDPFGWRKNKIKNQGAVITAQATQSKADTGVNAASDRTNTEKLTIIREGAKEIHYVQTLPANETATDPARADALCASLRRVLDATACTASPELDSQPESGL